MSTKPKAREKKPAHRPSKLNPAMITKIAEGLRGGGYREVVAAHAGIAVSTLYAWLERGEADLATRDRLEAEGATDAEIDATRTLFSELSEAATRAEAEAELEASALILSAAKDDWRAAAEFLRRRHTKRWTATERLEVEGDHRVHGGVAVHVTPEPERQEEIARILDQAHAFGDGDG